MTAVERRKIAFKNAINFTKSKSESWNLLDTMQLVWIMDRLHRNGSVNIRIIRPMVRKTLEETKGYKVQFVYPTFTHYEISIKR